MKRLFLRLLALFPTKLPQGIEHFNRWASSIIHTYGLPDNDSIRFALAVQILHLPATAAYKSKEYFGRTLIKGAASQVAGAVMQDLKDKQQAKIEADKQAEATPAPAEVASDDQKA